MLQASFKRIFFFLPASKHKQSFLWSSLEPGEAPRGQTQDTVKVWVLLVINSQTNSHKALNSSKHVSVPTMLELQISSSIFSVFTYLQFLRQ